MHSLLLILRTYNFIQRYTTLFLTWASICTQAEVEARARPKPFSSACVVQNYISLHVLYRKLWYSPFYILFLRGAEKKNSIIWWCWKMLWSAYFSSENKEKLRKAWKGWSHLILFILNQYDFISLVSVCNCGCVHICYTLYCKIEWTWWYKIIQSFFPSTWKHFSVL